jgi:taurine dioxygenase
MPDITRLQTPFEGRRVDDVDLTAPIPADTGHRLRSLLGKHSVLVFTQPGVEPEHQIRLMDCFGAVGPEAGASLPYAMISNAGDPSLVSHSRRLLFHSDAMFRAQPYYALSLYALQTPAGGAPTTFARTSTDLLPQPLIDRIRPLRGEFLTSYGGGDERYRRRDEGTDGETAAHPLVMGEPYGGTEVATVDELFLAGADGMDEGTFESLRSEVHSHLYDEANVYTHDWAPNDLVVWSNLAVQHGRPAFDGGGRRVLRRVVATAD